MTREEAMEIINLCKNWNENQRSTSLIFNGKRTAADDAFDARRVALAKAWQTISETS